MELGRRAAGEVGAQLVKKGEQLLYLAGTEGRGPGRLQLGDERAAAFMHVPAARREADVFRAAVDRVEDALDVVAPLQGVTSCPIACLVICACSASSVRREPVGGCSISWKAIS